MTPENALAILEQATGILQASRQDHQNIQLALNTIKISIMNSGGNLNPNLKSHTTEAPETTTTTTTQTEDSPEAPKTPKEK